MCAGRLPACTKSTPSNPEPWWNARQVSAKRPEAQAASFGRGDLSGRTSLLPESCFVSGSSVLRFPNAFEAARFRQVFHCRLTPNRLRIKAHQIQKLRRNIGPYRQAETLCRLVGDLVVMCPGYLGLQAVNLLRLLLPTAVRQQITGAFTH